MKTSLLFCLFLAYAMRVSAAVVVEYPFPALVTSGAPIVHDINLTATNPAWVGLSTPNGFGGNAGNAYVGSANKIPVFDAGKYLTFTVNAKEGFTLQLNAFQFELGGTTPTSALTVYAEVRTSIDGFSNSLQLSSGETNIASHVVVPGNSAPVYSPFSVPLGTGFESLDSITFHIHVYLTTTVTNAYLRMDSFKLEGTTQAVPEPSAIGLLVAAAGLAIVMTRRHHSWKQD